MNDYHAAFNDMCESGSYKDQQWFGTRQYLVTQYGWAIPNAQVIDYMSDQFDSLIEVGAGDGYWAKLLDDAGVSVDAYDTKVGSKHYDVLCENAYDLSDEITGKPLLMVWPPVNKPLAEDMARMSPSDILYVGTERGGCTADDGFFDVLHEQYELVEEIDIPSYESVSDNFYHYTKI